MTGFGKAALRLLREALGADAALHLVGGAVRDRLLGREGGDWDLATALMPEEVCRRAKAHGLKPIPTGIQHGTITVLVEHRLFEITTFRSDDGYLDGRHPVSVRFGVGLEEDLARRDFTINAMAVPVEAFDRPDWRVFLVDPFGGRADLEGRIIRAVGDPLARFAEDGLRPLRACRFASQLDFAIEPATLAAIPERLEVARKVAVERVFVELSKLLAGQAPERGLEALEGTGLLDLWLPELRPMVGCPQNHHHRFDVWRHTMEVLRNLPADAALRWAALLHDAGKPGTRTLDEAGEAHFYGHEGASERIAEAILPRLKASRALAQEVGVLIRHHGEHPGEAWGSAACRRLLRRFAEDGLPLERWACFRRADLLGKGWGEEPCRAHEIQLARLRELASARPPLSARELALDGRDLQRIAQRSGGPWLGQLQRRLLEAVIDEPGLNTAEALEKLARTWLAEEA